ncbi:MAG: SURF1 family protein [Rhodospirillaceae bacterium]|nr:SURF1 family protein [Rhodospirillaceae bacterium]
MARTASARAGFLIFMALVIAGTAGLGVWQLERRAWKHALIARIEERMTAAPAALPPHIDDADAWDHRPALAEGVLVLANAVRVIPRVRAGAVGAHVVAPLVREGGSDVLVVLGWVPQDWQIPEGATAGAAEGMAVSVAGIAQLPDPPGLFTPDNVPTAGQWYFVDTAAMAAAMGLDDAAPVILVATTPVLAADGPPFPEPPGLELTDNHLQYALTWFGLATVLAALTVVFHRRLRDR